MFFFLLLGDGLQALWADSWSASQSTARPAVRGEGRAAFLPALNDDGLVLEVETWSLTRNLPPACSCRVLTS
jgi:hypothetical protein